MRRTSIYVAGVLVFSSVFSQNVLAQNAGPQRAPAVPSTTPGPQLVAWSELQKPQPIPHFVVPVPPDSPVSSQHRVDAQPPLIQVLSGTIVKDGETYLLQVSAANVHPIDDQEQARPYEGKRVAIAGILDPGTNSLQVSSIEALP